MSKACHKVLMRSIRGMCTCIPITLIKKQSSMYAGSFLVQSKQNHENTIFYSGLCKPFCCLQIRFVPSWLSRFRIVVVRLRRSRKRGKAPWCHGVRSTLSRLKKKIRTSPSSVKNCFHASCVRWLKRYLKVGGDDLTWVLLENIHPGPNVINRCYPNLPQPTLK